ncbi:MAG TPA: glycosyltransferase [Casimicrobium sp.]|nr:glycosyltransferase [Casimicrobium sp.]
MIDVLIVAYHPDVTQLSALAEALIDAKQKDDVPLSVRVCHNDGDTPTSGPVLDVYVRLRAAGIDTSVRGGEGNIGFGGAINKLVGDSAAPFVLALNQDAIPEPGALRELFNVASNDAPSVAAWEMRQIPYEHPKVYDPVTLDTEWVSGAAVLLRTSSMREVEGFDSRIFMYGEDVDLSWRLRCAGFRLRYLARAAVVHHTYSKPDEVKPLQALEGIYVNLCLRARYAGHRQILSGLSMAIGEMMLPESFPGRRAGIARAMMKFSKNYRYFWRSHKSAQGFEPRFAGWGYEIRRDGAFHPFLPRADAPTDLPLVSILIRTHKRGAFLRQALTTVANQTHRPIEAVVVEDGSDEGADICREFEGRLDVRYFRLSPSEGRSVAGNRALAEARGEWFCFLDDDDVLFADHVEVLLQTVREQNLKGAYALAWRTMTRVLDSSSASYQELSWDRFPDEAFSRVALWHHNFMPIQAVLFHRSLFEKYGGFAVDMDQLEDWNLWTRYTIESDFVQVRKTTSKYRVPAETTHNADRQAKLDAAYSDAIRRQSDMTFSADPTLVRKLAEDYVRSNALIHVGRDQVRARFSSWPALARIASLRHVLRRRLSRANR